MLVIKTCTCWMLLTTRAAQAVQGSRLLTVGDEEGCVSIVDTSAATLPDSLYTDAANPPRARWLAHNNTIFDMAWAKVGEGRRAPACLPVPPPSLSPPPTHTHMML